MAKPSSRTEDGKRYSLKQAEAAITSLQRRVDLLEMTQRLQSKEQPALPDAPTLNTSAVHWEPRGGAK